MDKLIEAIKYSLEQSISGTSSPIATVNRVFFGDPKKIKEDLFPVITVMPMNTGYEDAGTEYDRKRSTVQIRLIFNQKNFFNNYIGTSKTITNAVYSASYVTFSVATHGYSAGDSIKIASVVPTAFNCIGEVYDVPTAGSFRIAFSSNPGTWTSGGTATKGTLDKVYMVEKAIQMVENTGNTGDTGQYTICGTIQRNKNMQYVNSSGTTVYACDNIRPTSVEYVMSEDRGYPTFEVIVTCEALILGNR